MIAYVIDDDPSSAKILQKLIEREGLTCQVFNSAEAAWNETQMAVEQPDFLICDWELTGESGLDFGKKVRDHRAPDEPYLMMVTAHGDRTSLSRALQVGFNGFMQKPIDPIQFRAHIGNAKKIRRTRNRFELRLAETLQSLRVEALYQSISTFAHEVNNPLAVILSRGSLLEKELLSAKPNIDGLKYQWESLSKNLGTLGRIVASQVRQIKPGLHPSSSGEGLCCLFDQVLSNITDLLSHRAAALQVQITKQPTEGQIEVEIETSSLEEVLINLINNAIDAAATSNTEKWVDIRASHDEDFASLQISDSGPGVPKRIHQTLMRPFITTKESGTGLGLFISKQLIEKVGGTLRYLGHEPFTTFEIKIPLKNRIRQSAPA